METSPQWWEKVLKEKANLGDFELKQFLGEGTFGRVFKAELKGDLLKTPYAIKIILKKEKKTIPEVITLGNYYSRIYECCPDCIVNVLPHFFRDVKISEREEYIIIVSQYLPLTLKELEGKLNLKEAINLTVKLIRCLRSFSSVGLLYTDLKPQNLGTDKGLNTCKVIDLGGFTDKETPRLTGYTPTYVPPEFTYNRFKDYLLEELKDGRGYTYTVAIIFGQLLGILEIKNSRWTLRDSLNPPLKELLEKALSPRRGNRPPLDQFEELLLRYSHQRVEIETVEKPKKVRKTAKLPFPKREIKKSGILKGIEIKSGEVLVLENGIYTVEGDIKINPGGYLIIRNSVLKFAPNGGILGKDCTVEVENSEFLPLEENWKNVTLTGKVKGFIRNSLFEKGNGRPKSDEGNITWGGAILSEIRQGEFLIENSVFKNCFAHNGGSVAVNGKVSLKSCFFENSYAQNLGGAIYSEGGIIENCNFNNCLADFGGGVYSKNTEVKGSIFKVCYATRDGGGLYCYNGVVVEECEFKGCSARSGGGILAVRGNKIRSSRFIDCLANFGGGAIKFVSPANKCFNNTFENCTPDNIKGRVKC